MSERDDSFASAEHEGDPDPAVDVRAWLAAQPTPALPADLAATLDATLADLVAQRRGEIEGDLAAVRVSTEVDDLSDYPLWATHSTRRPQPTDPPGEMVVPLVSEVTVLRAAPARRRRAPSVLLIAASFTLLGYAGTYWLKAGEGDAQPSIAADSSAEVIADEAVSAPSGGLVDAQRGPEEQNLDSRELRQRITGAAQGRRGPVGRISMDTAARLFRAKTFSTSTNSVLTACATYPTKDPVGPNAYRQTKVIQPGGFVATRVPRKGSQPALILVYRCGLSDFPVFQFYDVGP